MYREAESSSLASIETANRERQTENHYSRSLADPRVAKRIKGNRVSPSPAREPHTPVTNARISAPPTRPRSWYFRGVGGGRNRCPRGHSQKRGAELRLFQRRQPRYLFTAILFDLLSPGARKQRKGRDDSRISVLHGGASLFFRRFFLLWRFLHSERKSLRDLPPPECRGDVLSVRGIRDVRDPPSLKVRRFFGSSPRASILYVLY
jgi:hypothetical protein